MPNPRPVRRRDLLPALLLLAGILAYHNSLTGPFIFDDSRHLLENEFHGTLWPLWKAFEPWSPRSFVSFTFSLNSAAGGQSVLGYHLTNLLIHLLAGLALYGILRRTFSNPRLPERYPKHSGLLAFLISLLWLVHPLQTQSVTYMVQRAESLMGLCYLTAVYFSIRGMEGAKRGLSPFGWEVLSVVMCTLGMMSKQVMVTAPLMVLLYDRVFFSGSFLQAVKKRRRLYGGYVLSWLLLGVLMSLEWNRTEVATAGFQMKEITPWQYAMTQPGVILHYLKLAFWPNPLVLDYHWLLVQNPGEALLPGLILLFLLGTALWFFVKKPAIGFLGAWFFLILAPTSSFMPIADIAFEHRMYLPLAAVMTLMGVACFELFKSKNLVTAVLGMIAVSYGFLTVQRNEDYSSSLAIWEDTVQKRPLNPRAHNNLGKFLLLEGDPEKALSHFREALRIHPGLAAVHNNIGITLGEQGRSVEAVSSFKRALEINPDFSNAHYNLGVVLNRQGKLDEAKGHLEKAIAAGHQIAKARNNLGILFMKSGKIEAAVETFHQALKEDPGLADAYNNLGIAAMQAGRFGKAHEYYEKGLELDTGNPELYNNLGILFIKEGNTKKAIEVFEQSAALDPGYADVQRNLGTLYADQEEMDQSIAHYEKALQLDPGDSKTHANLGAIWLTQGDFEKAETHLRRALSLDPQHVQAKANLENLQSKKAGHGTP